MTSGGTLTAASKQLRSCSSAPFTYSFPPSRTAWCSPLTTSAAARSTTSGHSAAASAADSGRTAPNARTAGSTEHGSAPACRSTEVIVTASSPTAHELVRSPKSITPSGVRSPPDTEQTTLSSVTSPWIAWTGRSPASGWTRRQAPSAASVTQARRPVRHRPRAKPGHGAGQFRRGVLGLDLGPAERRVRDLQHAGRPAVPPQEEVAVLLAAQRKSTDLQTERARRQPFRLRHGHQRDGEPAVREEVDPGPVRG